MRSAKPCTVDEYLACFTTDKPLPAALVRKPVKARLAENLDQRGKSK
jgi:hypothetical protein